VLRFWESRFTQIRPLKRGGGRRYYRPDDVDLLRGVRHLLYGEGYTIRGVQRILREEGLSFVQGVWRTGAEQPAAVELEDEDEDEAESAGEFEGEAEAEDEAESEAKGEVEPTSGPREPSFFAGASTTATRAEERREPNIVPPAAAPVRLSADSQSRQKLQTALDELVACRGLIQAVLTDPALPQERPDEAS
jgi:DNA-binding transcriptional MerR regulator